MLLKIFQVFPSKIFRLLFGQYIYYSYVCNMKKIPQIIASLKLICLAAIIISAFVAIWTDGTLALQIAGTAVLGLVVLWFVSHVFRNVFDAIVKEQVKEQMVQRKSKWQQKLESIQAEQKQKESNTFITETLDEMLADSIKEDTK